MKKKARRRKEGRQRTEGGEEKILEGARRRPNARDRLQTFVLLFFQKGHRTSI